MLARKRIAKLNDFSGGIITKIAELNDMDIKGTPDAMDVYTDLDKALRKRKGATKLNTAPVGAGTKESNGFFDYEGTLIGSFGTTYYKMEEIDGTWDSLQTGMEDEIVEFEDYSGNLVITNWGGAFAKTMQVGDTSMTTLNSANAAGRAKHPKVYEDHLLMSGVPGAKYTFSYSQVNDFDDFEDGGTWPIVTNDGDILTGWGELQGRLYALKRWSIHQLTYRGGSPYWVRREIKRGVGTRSSRTAKNVTLKNGEEVIMFQGSDGKIYQFDGYDATPVSANFEENNGIAPLSMDTLNQGAFESSHATVDPVKHWYILYVANGGTSTITHGIIYNYFTGAMWPFSNQLYKSSVSALDANNRRWIIVGDYHGTAYRWQHGNVDEVPFNNMETGTDGSLRDAESYIVTAGGFLQDKVHDGEDNKTYAVDQSENFGTLGAIVGDGVVNKTTGGHGEISAIGNSGLGGTNDKLTLETLTTDDFDDDDVFDVYFGGFVADNDSLYIGSAVPFNTAIIDLITAASGTITPSFFYSSDAAGAYTALTVTDGTTGFTASGVMTWALPSDWTKTNVDDGANAFTDTTTYYYLKIQRTANALTTLPKVSKINIANRVAPRHTTARLLIDKDKLSKFPQVVASLKSVSDDNVTFNYRSDYNETWSDDLTIKLGKNEGESGDEYYLGVDNLLNTGTLGPARQVKEETVALDLISEYLQFKISDSVVTDPWVLYSYSFPLEIIGITKQEL